MRRPNSILSQIAAAIAVLLFTGVTGCGGSASRSTGFSVQDSAGVEIASSSVPAWRDGRAWSVSPQPTLRLGNVARDTATNLADVKDALMLSDGGVVVAEGTTLRYFAADGSFVRAVGRAGDGPGEYRSLSRFNRLSGDSLLIYDVLLSRATLLDEQGELVTSVRLTGEDGSRPSVAWVYRLRDGSYIGIGGWSTGQLSDSGPRLQRPNTAAVRFARTGELLDTIVKYPSADMAYMTFVGSLIPGQPPREMTIRGLVLFSRISSALIRNDLLYVGTADALQISVYDLTGRLLRILRGPDVDLSISTADVETAQSARRGNSDDPSVAQYFDALFAVMPQPERKPAYKDMFVDPAGNVWLSPFVEDAAVNAPWSVFGANGRFLGNLSMPPELAVLDVDEDFVIGLWRDSLDVPYVVTHRIVR